MKVASGISLSFILLTISLITSSCVTRLTTPEGIPDVSLSDYDSLIDKKSQKIQIYDGLYNQLTVQATWLDSEVTEAGLSHNARLYQWTQEKYREEKTKVISRHTEKTEFFVSLYTPERKHNDLSKKNTAWKIFLDVDGKRYEGIATRVKNLFSETQVMYPYHNKWSTPYIVTFPVATSLIERKSATLTLTGAISTSQLKF